MPIPQMDELKARLVAYGQFVQDMIEKSRRALVARQPELAARDHRRGRAAGEQTRDRPGGGMHVPHRAAPAHGEGPSHHPHGNADHERPGAHRRSRGEHRGGRAWNTSTARRLRPDDDVAEHVRGNDPHGGPAPSALSSARTPPSARRSARRTTRWMILPRASWRG